MHELAKDLFYTISCFKYFRLLPIVKMLAFDLLYLTTNVVVLLPSQF